MKIRVENWCNDTDRETPKYWVKKLSESHFLLKLHTVELGYNVTKGTEYFVSLQTSSVTLWLTVRN
jgi:hypothetical protein